METPLLETETTSPSAGVDAGWTPRRRKRKRGREGRDDQKTERVYFAWERARAKRVHVKEREEERTAEQKREVRSRREKKTEKQSMKEDGEREQGGNDIRDEGKDPGGHDGRGKARVCHKRAAVCERTASPAVYLSLSARDGTRV
jgi:hypothetical protein